MKRFLSLTFLAILLASPSAAMAQQDSPSASEPASPPEEGEESEGSEQEAPQQQAEPATQEAQQEEQAAQDEQEIDEFVDDQVARCQSVGTVEVGDRAVSACEDGRVIIDTDQGRQVRQAPGRIEKLLVDGDQIYVVTRQRQATDVADLPSGAIAAGAPRPVTDIGRDDVDGRSADNRATPEVTTGQVLTNRNGLVIIDLGAAQGIVEGDHVEFYGERTVDLGDGEEAAETIQYAVAPVRAVSESRAEVQLGLMERVPDTAGVRPTDDETTGDTTSPPRLGSLTRLQFALRPFLALQTLGAGTVSHGLIAHHFQGPWALEAIFEPLAVGLSEEGGLFAVTGVGIFSYDTTLFQVGLGVGATTVDTGSFANQDLVGEDEQLERIGAFAIAQKIRLGSLDGLHLEALNSFFLANREFRYNGTTVKGQVPVGSLGLAENSWLIARGGGSAAGHGFGEIGLRVLVRGNGDRGSLFFTPTIGGAQLRGPNPEAEQEPGQGFFDNPQLSYGGPMIGFEAEWRL